MQKGFIQKKNYTAQFVTKPGARFQNKAAENCVSLLHYFPATHNAEF